MTTPQVNLDSQETQIKSIHTDQTGGNIYNDVIELKNGFIIRIGADGLSIYKNDKDDENGNDIANVEFIEPDFINSILEEEKKDFPKDIEVIIDSSNNPHGEYKLTVCKDDDIIGTYYYDSKEDAEKDGYKLEDFFEVTFN